jgi:hypothetical protein
VWQAARRDPSKWTPQFGHGLIVTGPQGVDWDDRRDVLSLWAQNPDGWAAKVRAAARLLGDSGPCCGHWSDPVWWYVCLDHHRHGARCSDCHAKHAAKRHGGRRPPMRLEGTLDTRTAWGRCLLVAWQPPVTVSAKVVERGRRESPGHGHLSFINDSHVVGQQTRAFSYHDDVQNPS